MSAPTVDYYTTLEINDKATQQQIRDAYKKAALNHHPDRVPSDSPERPRRTRKFQQINDAYYTLSDPSRRHNYDSTRTFHGFSSKPSFSSSSTPNNHADPHYPQPSSSSSTSWANNFPWSFFSKGSHSNPPTEEEASRFSNEQFGSVFEEMLREQGMAEGEHATPTGKFWSMVGGLSGGAMGFIIANFPGAIAGAVAGNWLGAVRDNRGKSVYSVFQELPAGDKAKLLSQMAAKVFSHAVSA